VSTATLDLRRPWEWVRPSSPASWDVIAFSALAGVGLDVVYRYGPPTIAGAALVCVVAGALLASRRVTNPQAIGLVLAAPLFGMWFAIRMSPWLLPLDLLAAAALLCLGASYARGGSVLDLSVPRATIRAVQALANGALGGGFLTTALPPQSGRYRPLLRGALLAVPILVACGALLASADAVFASVFRFDAGTVLTHVVVIAVGAWSMAGLIRAASVPVVDDTGVPRPRLGSTEWTVVLGGLNVLLAGFAAARIVAASQGGRRVIRTAGLTYAEYARSGFFQLIAVAAITIGTVIALRALVDPDDHRARRRFLVLAELTIALNVVVVVSAAQRLVLYERAFGLTMPRLLATTICVWLALTLIALAVWVAGVAAHRHWFWSATGVAALALLFALNAMNAEAFVVRHNVGRPPAAGRVDPKYLVELGEDAAPTLAAALPRMAADTRAIVLGRLCLGGDQRAGPWWSYNGSRDGAIEAHNNFCQRSSR
jgi:hypothetical protein